MPDSVQFVIVKSSKFSMPPPPFAEELPDNVLLRIVTVFCVTNPPPTSSAVFAVNKLSLTLSVPVMLSGGFRSRTAMIDAVESGAADVIGLARPIAVEPDFPRRILDGTTEVSLATPPKVGNKNIDDLLSGAWYQEQIARLGRGKPTLPNRTPMVGLAIMLATTLRDRLIVRVPALAGSRS